MQLSSLKHLSLKKLCDMVDRDLNPELINKLTSLALPLQEVLTHYLLRADERRRTRVKEVCQVQPRFEQVAAYDFKYLEGFKEGLVNKVVLSSSGRYAIIETNNYSDDFPEDGTEPGPWRRYLYVLDLADMGKVLHQETCDFRIKDKIASIVISPLENYYGIIEGPAIHIYDFQSFEKVKSIDSTQLDFYPTALIFSQDDCSIFFMDQNRTIDYKVFTTSTDCENELIEVLGYVPWSCTKLAQHPNYDYLFATGQGQLDIMDIQTGSVLKDFDLDRLDYGTIFFDPYDLCFIAVDTSKSFTCQWDYLTKQPKRVEYKFYDRAWGGKEERKYGTWYELPDAPIVVCGTLPYMVRTIYENRAWKLTLHDIYTGSLESEISVGPAREVDTEEHWFHMMGQESGDLSELDDKSFCIGNGNSAPSAERTVLAINKAGTVVFFINDVLRQGYFLKVEDLNVSLPDLLSIIYADALQKALT